MTYSPLPDYAMVAFIIGGYSAVQALVACGLLDAGCYECATCRGTGKVNHRIVHSVATGRTFEAHDDCNSCLGGTCVVEVTATKSQRRSR